MASKGLGFHDYVVHDVLGGIAHINSRKMFGGWGVYREGKIFAIIVDEKLFLRGTGPDAAWFESNGSSRFTYATSKHPRPIAIPYWSVPGDVLEDRELFSEWLSHALL